MAEQVSPTRIEPLGGGLFIEVSREHGFGEDALLLARFADLTGVIRLCDLGTGCGIIPMVLCRRYPALGVQALELQENAVRLAKRSVESAGLGERLVIHHADLCEWPHVLAPASQQIVTCNPPYFSKNTGKLSASAAVRIARHEGERCTFADVASAAYGLLEPRGAFVFCHRPERLADVMQTLISHGFTPKRLQFVHNQITDSPWLFLCEARKGKAVLEVLPPKVRTLPNGTPNKAWDDIYE